MNSHQEKPPADLSKQMAHINRALGLFLMIFSGIVLFSILFTETTLGKCTNATAGLILAAIGAVLFFKSKTTPASPDSSQDKPPL